MNAKVSSGDIILLVINAILEAYGLPHEVRKLSEVLAIISEVADGRRSLHFSPTKYPNFRKEFEKEFPDRDFESFANNCRELERAAAKFLKYGEIPPDDNEMGRPVEDKK